SEVVDGEGWNATVSRIGALRPLARYASPTRRTKSPGDRDPASSLPLCETARPRTFTFGNAACRTSWHCASTASYAAGDAGDPSAFSCGFQNWLLFGSFQITTSRTEG